MLQNLYYNTFCSRKNQIYKPYKLLKFTQNAVFNVFVKIICLIHCKKMIQEYHMVDTGLTIVGPLYKLTLCMLESWCYPLKSYFSMANIINYSVWILN